MEEWKRGPLLKILGGGEQLRSGNYFGGFTFADFQGDHATLPMHDKKRVDANDVVFYNNDIQLPINVGE